MPKIRAAQILNTQSTKFATSTVTVPPVTAGPSKTMASFANDYQQRAQHQHAHLASPSTSETNNTKINATADVTDNTGEYGAQKKHSLKSSLVSSGNSCEPSPHLPSMNRDNFLSALRTAAAFDDWVAALEAFESSTASGAFVPPPEVLKELVGLCIRHGKLADMSAALVQLRERRQQLNICPSSSIGGASDNIDALLLQHLSKTEYWEAAVDLLRRIRNPCVESYNAAICACERSMQWEQALVLYTEMKSKGVEPNAVTFAALIAVTEISGLTQQRTKIMSEIPSKSVNQIMNSYSAAINKWQKRKSGRRR